MHKYFNLILAVIVCFSCNTKEGNNYKNDVELLSKHTNIIELTTNSGQSRIAISPEFQGKIMTSTNNGLTGLSNGWINKKALIENSDITGSRLGGEERLWIGPLGSQFSFYYQQLKPLMEKNWKVPASFNDEAYELISSTEDQVSMQKNISLTNFIGTPFNLNVYRTITILQSEDIIDNLNIAINPKIKHVAYETSHSLVNTGNEKWSKETGLASLWSAGMFEGSDKAVVIIPLKENADPEKIYLYMGALDSSRLKFAGNTVLFKADGKYRSKIGVPKYLAPTVYGCYKPENNTLTIIQYMQTNDSLYFNSHVSTQKNPYSGEAIPIYNNGTMDYSPTDIPSFYELESTSAMLELAPSDTLKHFHRVYHFSGSHNDLNFVSQELLGIELLNCNF